MGMCKEAGDRVEYIRADNAALKRLTLEDVARMAARREIDGWYVAPCESRWAIGRKSGSDYLPVMLGTRAMTFETMAVAEKYLRALLTPTGVEYPAPSPLELTIVLAEASAASA